MSDNGRNLVETAIDRAKKNKKYVECEKHKNITKYAENGLYPYYLVPNVPQLQPLIKQLQAKYKLETYIAGDPGPAPELICEATRLEACDIVKSPAAGVLSYTVELGQTVRDGDILAWLIDPAADDPVDARRAIPARSSGFVLNRRAHKYVVAGLDIAKVVGTEPLAWRSEGQLMTD